MADNLTHGLVGALLAQTGLQQRYGPAATVALVVGAELPDLDSLFALGGPVLSFVHHRGMTHSLLGGAGLALVGALLLWRLFRAHPYWRLLLWTYLGVLLHIGMDVLTPYGTQVFWPWTTNRYSANALFMRSDRAIDPSSLSTCSLLCASACARAIDSPVAQSVATSDRT
jgi:inner membrane protein